MKNLGNSIKGCILGASVADALAMPLMIRSPQMIRDEIGGGSLVCEIKQPTSDVQGHAKSGGTVTDVFSLSKAFIESYIDEREVNSAAATRALLNWSNSDYCNIFAGKNTKRGIVVARGEYEETRFDRIPCIGYMNTNGAASRGFVAGLLAPGNIEKAIDNAIKQSIITHTNAIAISGAAVVAALCSVALTDKINGKDVVEISKYAAQASFDKAERIVGKTAVGSKIQSRIDWAVDCLFNSSFDDQKIIDTLADNIGFGSYASETVPSAVAILAFCIDDTKRAITIAANAGNQSNKTAAIVGAIAGARNGVCEFLESNKNIVETANNYNLSLLCEKTISFTK